MCVWSPTQSLVNVATGVVAHYGPIFTFSHGLRNIYFSPYKTSSNEKSTSTSDSERPLTGGMNSPNQDIGSLPQKPNPVYMDPIKKQQVHTFVSLGKDKEKVTIIEEELHSCAAILAEFD